MPARRNGPVSSNVRRHITRSVAIHAKKFIREAPANPRCHQCLPSCCERNAGCSSLHGGASPISCFGSTCSAVLSQEPNCRCTTCSRLGRSRLDHFPSSTFGVPKRRPNRVAYLDFRMVGRGLILQQAQVSNGNSGCARWRCNWCIGAIPTSPKLHHECAAKCRLTIRSTGPIAAGRHLGYKSLAQMPTHRNGPVSSNVRPHKSTSAPSLEITKHLMAAISAVSPLEQKSMSK